MKKTSLTLTLAMIMSGMTVAAWAEGEHEGVHGANGNAEVERTISVEAGDMWFDPEEMNIAPGETVKFEITNTGSIEHEFVIDTMEGNAEHKESMAKMDMEHDDPNSVRLDSGMEGEVIWTFANEGTFEFACLIPGHYESGMHGPITVAQSDEAPETPAVYSTGKIKKVDAKGKKVTIIHGPLENLDMPSMTMVFKADEALIAKMKEGQNIEFVADRVKGKLTVTAMK